MIILAVTAGSSASFGMAAALTSEFVTLRLHGSSGVAVASFASGSRGDLPVIRCASVALTADHVGETTTLSCLPVAVLQLGLNGAQEITIATPAVLSPGFSPIARLALFAVEPDRVVLTLGTLSSVDVARAWLIEVDIVVALASSAASARRQWIAKVIVIALIASGTSVSRTAVAHHILGSGVSRVADELAGVSKLLAGGGASRAHASATRNAHSKTRIAVITVNASLAISSTGGVLAVITDARSAVAIDCVSVASTWLALRESVISGLTLVAAASVSAGDARTLTRHLVAKVGTGSGRLAIACLTSLRTEAKVSRSATVASPSDDIDFTLTLSSVFVAHSRHGTSRVALAFLSLLKQ